MVTLADRIAFEVSRALEWRDGVLARSVEPLTPDDGAEFPATSPAELAVARARALSGEAANPGGVMVAVLRGLVAAACILMALGGAQLARSALGTPGGAPVNIAWFLFHALAAQTTFLLLTLFAMLPAVPGTRTLRSFLRDSVSLGSWLVAAALRVAVRRGNVKEPAGLAASTHQAVGRLRGLRSLPVSIRP